MNEQIIQFWSKGLTRRSKSVSRAKKRIPYGMFLVDCVIAVTNASVHHCRICRSAHHKFKCTITRIDQITYVVCTQPWCRDHSKLDKMERPWVSSYWRQSSFLRHRFWPGESKEIASETDGEHILKYNTREGSASRSRSSECTTSRMIACRVSRTYATCFGRT